MSSACFEHHVFIIRKTICTCSFYGMFLMRLCEQSSTMKALSITSFHLLDCLHKCMKNIPYKTACLNGLPDDEHTIFETRRRHKELN